MSKFAEQLYLDFYNTTLHNVEENYLERLGTFQDSLRAPIHRWFKYPAGFSYRLVYTFIDSYHLNNQHWILDPFAGCGTTSVAAKERGVNSIGIEAHPFVHWVAQVKIFWEYDLATLHRRIQNLIAETYKRLQQVSVDEISSFPLLLHKCYSPLNLAKLKTIRDTIEAFDCTEEERNLFRLALTDTLRTSSSAGTGWPYIAPSKYHAKQERDAFESFREQICLMYDDLKKLQLTPRPHVETRLLLMDAREPYPLEAASIDMAITSPPYLNNYDYADRTRLEMYFWGWATSWREITEKVRERLITAATTQIRRSHFPDSPLDQKIESLNSQVYNELKTKVEELERRRLSKGGKKSYDLMVAGYFNDMTLVLQQVHRVLKPGAPFVLVLGDSAPYGVHIPTDEYLGQLGIGVGFRDYRIQPLRHRGDKWGHNPQRHRVALRESLLILER